MKMTNRWNRFIYRLWAPVYDAMLNHLFLPGRKQADAPRAVSALLAGIVLVDLLAVAGIPTEFAEYLAVFPLLFIAALALQRFVPAT